MENYVAQELARSRYGLYYWTSAGRAELDFLIQHSDAIYPVEVKSGPVGRLRSLHQFMDLVDHPFAIRLYGHQLRIDSIKTLSGKPFHLLNLPYYLAGKLDVYLEWFIERVI